MAVNADLEPKLPMLSSGVMVEYDPVVIGGKIYICPTRSVSIQRTRTVKLVKEWGESFGVYGRFETILNDFFLWAISHLPCAVADIAGRHTGAEGEIDCPNGSVVENRASHSLKAHRGS